MDAGCRILIVVNLMSSCTPSSYAGDGPAELSPRGDPRIRVLATATSASRDDLDAYGTSPRAEGPRIMSGHEDSMRPTAVACLDTAASRDSRAALRPRANPSGPRSRDSRLGDNNKYDRDCQISIPGGARVHARKCQRRSERTTAAALGVQIIRLVPSSDGGWRTRLCENVHERRARSIVCSIVFAQ